MRFWRVLAGFALSSLHLDRVTARALSGKPSSFIIPEKRAPLQDIVRSLAHSLIKDLTVAAGHMGRALVIRAR